MFCICSLRSMFKGHIVGFRNVVLTKLYLACIYSFHIVCYFSAKEPFLVLSFGILPNSQRAVNLSSFLYIFTC